MLDREIFKSPCSRSSEDLRAQYSFSRIPIFLLESAFDTHTPNQKRLMQPTETIQAHQPP